VTQGDGPTSASAVGGDQAGRLLLKAAIQLLLLLAVTQAEGATSASAAGGDQAGRVTSEYGNSAAPAVGRDPGRGSYCCSSSWPSGGGGNEERLCWYLPTDNKQIS
jgi:hypothetical protein